MKHKTSPASIAAYEAGKRDAYREFRREIARAIREARKAERAAYAAAGSGFIPAQFGGDLDLWREFLECECYGYHWHARYLAAIGDKFRV